MADRDRVDGTRREHRHYPLKIAHRISVVALCAFPAPHCRFALSTSEALSSLDALLRGLLRSGRAADKELRNEVAILAALVAGPRRSHALFRTSGLLATLVAAATAEAATAEAAPAAARGGVP